MFDKLKTISGKFVKVLELTSSRQEEINIKFKAMNFTADVISSTIFGVDCNTLENPNHELARILQIMFSPSAYLFARMVLTEGFANPGNIVKVFQSNKLVEDFFTRFIKDAIKIADESEKKQDNFLNALLELRDNSSLTFNEILAESFIFFAAGFETSSATIAFCIHELAYNQDVQDKLREEILQNLGSDCKKYCYEDVLRLSYLDKVFHETLRIYPALGYLNRMCVKQYRVPGTDLIIEKGTPVLISVLGIHRDPEYYPDPMKFDPERFDESYSRAPFTYFPFGEGPRICIGARLGKLQSKIGIAALISNFKFFPSNRTKRFIEYDKISTSPAMSPNAGIFVKIEKLNVQI